MTLNKEAHIKQMKETFKVLEPLSKEFAAPASEQLQYLGTAVDNTLVEIISAVNSLGGDPKILTFTSDLNWVSYMNSIHRSFFSSLVAVTEEGIKAKINTDNVRSKRDRLSKVLDTLPEVSRTKKAKILTFVGKTPEFMDYLEEAMKGLNEDRKDFWRLWFSALLIIRNAASHSNSTLSEGQRDKLRAAGLGAVINGDLISMNTGIYPVCFSYIREFYSEIDKA